MILQDLVGFGCSKRNYYDKKINERNQPLTIVIFLQFLVWWDRRRRQRTWDTAWTRGCPVWARAPSLTRNRCNFRWPSAGRGVSSSPKHRYVSLSFARFPRFTRPEIPPNPRPSTSIGPTPPAKRSEMSKKSNRRRRFDR